MARMVVIYKTPKDIESFNKHYFDVHVPLVKKLPGLRKYEASHGAIVSPVGGAGIFMIASLHFDSLEAIKTARATPVGQACAADRRILAPSDNDLQMYLFDNHEV